MSTAGVFWWAIGGMYLGLLLLVIDGWRGFVGHPVARALLVIISILAGAIFAWQVVLVSAPLHVSASVLKSAHDPDSKYGGIKWRPEYADIRVWVTNQSDTVYSDMDFRITIFGKALNIVDVKQMTTVPDVLFIKVSDKMDIMDGGDWNSLGWMGPTRVLVDRLHGEAPIRLLFVAVDIQPLMLAMQNKVSRGNQIEAYFGPRPQPSQLLIEGKYRARFRTHTFREVIDIQ